MADESSVVRVEQGQLRGVVKNSVYGERFLAFCGIPYAKPAVGSLRFKDPVPPESWTGIRDATEFGDQCAQHDLLHRELIGSDDCLYLNVYKPIKDSSKRAVMVWIHGGAFMNGSGNDNLYGPDYLLRKDIVLVTINYRLGVLGFLNINHEAATGNQGLKDQVMALKWVQKNISNFGGDPNNVTIFGESAGGASVHYLTLSPLSQGLFHKAIAQSGVAINPMAFLFHDPEVYAFKLASYLGEDSKDPATVVEFLRTIDPLELVSAERKIMTPVQRNTLFGLFGPSVDDKSPNPFLPQHPSILYKSGVKVPFMLGYNSNEGALLLNNFGMFPTSEEKCEQINKNFEIIICPSILLEMEKDGITPEHMKRLYFGDKPVSQETAQNYSDFISDMVFLQGIHDVLDVQLKMNDTPTYFYKFTYDCDDSMMRHLLNIQLPGSTHADDLSFLFYAYVSKKLQLPPPEPGSKRFKVIDYFTQLWTDFAKTGNPTPKTSEAIPEIWKPLEKGNEYNYFNMNLTPRMDILKKDQRPKLRNKY